jgi:hypothetical protein
VLGLESLLDNLAVVLEDDGVGVVVEDVAAVVGVGAEDVPGAELLAVEVATPDGLDGAFEGEET